MGQDKSMPIGTSEDADRLKTSKSLSIYWDDDDDDWDDDDDDDDD